ncbi:MAG: Lrp/AsnC family transcriptional regulator [Candidatus Dormibacteraeota bacterium]|uniref:Lrp/AsnC family transcriptional regulator n=1 Tax=Candidatus Amunia macphersoniae TaxID=3127014 RepID=A0A934KGC6_9BACT|nr:Lrp/AsnC family transcriptional regulator [Candidatus Dormibacteraeota bacterium]
MSTKTPAEQAATPRSAAPRLDAVDREILQVLAEDARISVAALAERAGISRAAAYTRLDTLRDSGVIDGFSVRVNPARAGLGVTAIVLISGRQPAWRSLRRRLVSMPEIEYCAFTTGEYDALLVVRVPDVETLRDVVLERLQASEEIRATQTIFVLDELVKRPLVLPQV